MRSLVSALSMGALLLASAGCGFDSPSATGSRSAEVAARTEQFGDSVPGVDPALGPRSAGEGIGVSGDRPAPAKPGGTTEAVGAAGGATTTGGADGRAVPGDEAETPTAVILKTGGVDQGFVDVIESLDGIEWLSLVEVGQVHLRVSHDSTGRPVDSPAPGFTIQLEARAYDQPDSVVDFAPDLVDTLRQIEDDELILSETSAELRRLDVGGSITFDNGAEYRVAVVLPDDVIGTSEVVFVGDDALTAAGAGRSARRLAFVGYGGTGPDLEAALLAAAGGDGVRVFGGRNNQNRDRQRTTLPAIRVKQIFGEFAFRTDVGSSILIDPAWTDANLVTVDLPLLGPAKCHRIFAEILTDVLQGLIDDGMSDVIDPGAFQGCWNPRRIAGSSRLSKHSWGMAADINFGNPLDGRPGSPIQVDLLERMLDADVISGHLWSATPDPGHFEYRGP